MEQPINSNANALEVLYWAIKERNWTNTNKAYDALCRLNRINTGGARRLEIQEGVEE